MVRYIVCMCIVGIRAFALWVFVQAPPPARLELPKAKLDAEIVNSKQWGIATDKLVSGERQRV